MARNAHFHPKRSGRFTVGRIHIGIVTASFGALIFGGVALAEAAHADDVSKTSHFGATKKYTQARRMTRIKRRETLTKIDRRETLTKIDAGTSVASAARLDKVYLYKGWDFPFLSFGDTLTQDSGGWRSALANAGFGLSLTNLTISETNMLNTPTRVPANFPPCTTRLPGLCAGSQVYFGQHPASWFNAISGYLTYDTSRWGIPDGQIAAVGYFVRGSDAAFSPASFSFEGLSWYQTLFDKRVEIKVGYIATDSEFIGSYVGGQIASPFGAAASIPVELGMSDPQAPAPAFRTTLHFTDRLYDEFEVQRSLPVNGPTGNVFFDSVQENPTGLSFSSGIPGTRVLYVDELGYKTEAMPGAPSTWVRFGVLYNTSEFKDLSKSQTNPMATVDGNSAVYFYGDRQLWQQDLGRAYRGIYAGVTAEYAQPNATAFYQYYEGRAYWIGPFDKRPTDMLSLVYNHNVVSPFLAGAVNNFSAETGIFARNTANTITLSYMLHLMPGVYATVGIGYTDHPSITFFKSEGSDLTFNASTYISF
jgi:porin